MAGLGIALDISKGFKAFELRLKGFEEGLLVLLHYQAVLCGGPRAHGALSIRPVVKRPQESFRSFELRKKVPKRAVLIL